MFFPQTLLQPIWGASMRKLIHEDGRVIGEYDDEWSPPPECDMAEGLATGKMRFVTVPDDELKARARAQRQVAIDAELMSLDIRRIRALAEGDSAKLDELNKLVLALRAERSKL